ncbi:MAG: hypothetical protein ABR886_11020 [Dehalococcoidales bacterium]|jgi:hypothetical protein
MGFVAAIIAGLGVISAVLGTLSILNIPSDPILSAKLVWPYWMSLAVVLILLAIACLLSKNQASD